MSSDLTKICLQMQLRFDGTFGFPGGIVDKSEELLGGLNRELEEEINWDSQKNKITWSDYYNTQVSIFIFVGLVYKFVCL